MAYAEDVTAHAITDDHDEAIIDRQLATHGLVEAIFVTEKNEVYVTPGLRSRFTLTDQGFKMIQ